MSKLLAAALLAWGVFMVPAPARQASRAPEQDKKRLLTALYQLERESLAYLSGKAKRGRLRERVKLLAGKKARGSFAGLDADLARAIRAGWRGWQRGPGAKSPRQYLAAIDRAKLRYSPGFDGGVDKFWDTLQWMAWGDYDTEEERKLLEQAEADSDWLRRNLEGVVLEGPAKQSFDALFRALADYQLTRDLSLLKAIADDLRVKVEHCEKTGTRADQTMEVSFHTVDPLSNAPQARWLVFAVPETTASADDIGQRVGAPSSPVTGRLMPGRYWFYAQREGQRACYELFVVARGRVNPQSFVLRQQCP